VLFLDRTLKTPEENLALDADLLRAAESELAEYLRVWESPEYCVVLGKHGQVSDDVDLEACRADGIPILRRVSGGGTVLLGPGCLNYTIVLRYDRAPGLHGVAESFGYCLGRVIEAIGAMGVPVEAQGTDLLCRARKFGGSAQRRQRTHFLHHGTILYRFEIPLITRYLKEPPRRPAHRAGRRHEEFLACLPCDRSALVEHLKNAWL
jgi:lipoate-protein ligase A